VRVARDRSRIDATRTLVFQYLLRAIARTRRLLAIASSPRAAAAAMAGENPLENISAK
jgi:hypothetical protein